MDPVTLCLFYFAWSLVILLPMATRPSRLPVESARPSTTDLPAVPEPVPQQMAAFRSGSFEGRSFPTYQRSPAYFEMFFRRFMGSMSLFGVVEDGVCYIPFTLVGPGFTPAQYIAWMNLPVRIATFLAALVIITCGGKQQLLFDFLDGRKRIILGHVTGNGVVCSVWARAPALLDALLWTDGRRLCLLGDLPSKGGKLLTPTCSPLPVGSVTYNPEACYLGYFCVQLLWVVIMYGACIRNPRREQGPDSFNVTAHGRWTNGTAGLLMHVKVLLGGLEGIELPYDS